MNNTTKHHKDERGNLSLTLPRKLDDLGLSPYEYRAYVHIVRYAGRDESGAYHESLPDGAAHCRMALSTYRKAVTSLAVKGLLERCDRVGETSVLFVNPTHKWRTQPTEQVQR